MSIGQEVRNGAPQAPESPSWWGRALRRTVYASFGAIARFLTQRHVHGLENFRNGPGTVVLTTHKNELDAVVFLPLIQNLSRRSGPLGRVGIVGIEIMFEPGFMSWFVVPRPRWASRMLFPCSIGRIMRQMRWYPIPLGRQRMLISHLYEILETHGDIALTEAFETPLDTLLPGATAGTTAKGALAWRHLDALFQLRSLAELRSPVRETLSARHKTRIDDSLRLFAGILDGGGAILMSPEGVVTQDGSFHGIKSGMSQIVHKCRRPVRLLPMAATYDLMTTGRPHVFFAIGPALEDVGGWERDRMDREASEALLRLTTVTMSQLAAYAVHRRARQAENEVPEATLRAEARDTARQLEDEGRLVDPRLLEEAAFDARFQQFLKYCYRERYFTRRNGVLVFDPAVVLDTSLPSFGMGSPWAFYANELASFTGLGAESAP